MKSEKLIIEGEVLENARRLEESALSTLVKKSYPFCISIFLLQVCNTGGC